MWLNGIPIIPYIDERDDKELLYLKNFLIYIHDVEDVRPILKKTFNSTMYDKAKDILSLISLYREELSNVVLDPSGIYDKEKYASINNNFKRNSVLNNRTPNLLETERCSNL